MPRPLNDSRGRQEPLLDIRSLARSGPGRRDRLSPVDIDRIAWTVRRNPEVMVKVLSRGGQNLKGVRGHLDYLCDRDGEEAVLETDDGERLTGRGVANELVEDWNLDLQEHRDRWDIEGRGRRSTKLVHKLVFSMPAGTPPQKVMAAVKNFAREEFGAKHRYVMALHTDEPHPHVHMVVKAVSERGERLHIRKATLRKWREDFARQLRTLGVAANATERAMRGQSRSSQLDGIYRAEQRRESRRMWARAEDARRDLLGGSPRAEPGKNTLLEIRKEVERGWREVSDMLAAQGHRGLAAEVVRFLDRMGPPRTDREVIADALREDLRTERVRQGPAR